MGLDCCRYSPVWEILIVPVNAGGRERDEGGPDDVTRGGGGHPEPGIERYSVGAS